MKERRKEPFFSVSFLLFILRCNMRDSAACLLRKGKEEEEEEEKVGKESVEWETKVRISPRPFQCKMRTFGEKGAFKKALVSASHLLTTYPHTHTHNTYILAYNTLIKTKKNTAREIPTSRKKF